MAIGIGIACFNLHKGLRLAIARPALRCVETSPQFFYPGFFLFTLIVALNFNPMNAVLLDVWRAAKGLTHF